MKKIILTGILAIAFINCIAQDTTGRSKNTEVCDHIVGVQVNGLIKQIVNSTSSSAANPYLLTYAMRSKKTGWGARVGIGYNSISNVTAIAYGQTKVDNTDMNLRLGVERAFRFSKRWSATAGIDLLYNHNDDVSSTIETNQSIVITSYSKTTISNFGGGPFGTLNYHINKRIWVGTEASFYYKTGPKDQTIDNTRTGMPSTESKISTTVSGGSFYMPVVFFLSVRF